MALVEFALLALYYAWPVARGRQTVGCFLLGLKVAPAATRKTPPDLALGLRRVVLAFAGLCSWPVLFILRGADGTTWYDRLTDTRVELVRYR